MTWRGKGQVGECLGHHREADGWMVDDEAMGVGLARHVAHIPQNKGRGSYCDSWGGGGR